MGDVRRLKLARLSVAVLDVVPKPDERPVYTGWVAWKLGIDAYAFERPDVWRALDRLARQGLVERVRDYLPPPTVYWRMTPTGACWDGSVEDLAKPIRRAYGR